MNTFKQYYCSLNESVFKTPTDAEVGKRLVLPRLKIVLDKLKLEGTLVDGFYNFGGDVDISHLELDSIEELDIRFGHIRGIFNCSYNRLKNLLGAPISVSGNFNCICNRLKNLNDAPKTVGGNFYCGYNKMKFAEADILKVCEVKGKIYV